MDRESIFVIDESTLSVQGNIVHLLSEREPARIDWKKSGAQYVIESTGNFAAAQLAAVHVQAGGAKAVLISVPSKDAPAFVYGVNHHEYLTTELT